MIDSSNVTGAPARGPSSRLVASNALGQLQFSFSDLEKALASGAAMPPTPPDPLAEFLIANISEARGQAERQGEDILLDRWACEACNSKNIERKVRGDGADWVWSCANCGTAFNAAEGVQQLRTLILSARSRKGKEPSQDWDHGIVVFSVEDLGEAVANAATISSDEHAKDRVKATVKRLLNVGTIRPIALPGAAWQTQLDELRAHFPNFFGAIDEVLEPSLAIAAAAGRARPAPLLLVGPAGIGKSHFSSMRSTLLQVPMFRVDMSSASTGAVIEGLSVHWGNSSPGELFKTLAWRRAGVTATANPLAFLDEIDKVSGDHRYDPMAPLYTLLEVESAKNFEDHSLLGVRIDASHVRWIACANNTHPIPKPILSRFHVVHVEAPTDAETVRMFERIFTGIVTETKVDFDVQIPKSIITSVIEKLSAREFKTRATMAIGRAIARNRRFVRTEDFGVAMAVAATRKMGSKSLSTWN